MSKIDEALKALQKFRRDEIITTELRLAVSTAIQSLEQQRLIEATEVGEIFWSEIRTIRQALEAQRDTEAAAQRMTDYLGGADSDPALYLSVPLDDGLANIYIDGYVNLYELARAALAATPEPE